MACLPPGVPYEDQQFRALMTEGGYLDIPAPERMKFGAQIAEALTLM